MRTRRILKYFLGVLIAGIVVLGGLLAWELFGQSQRVVDRTFSTASSEKKTEEKHRWEGRGDQAIEAVEALAVEGLTDELRERYGGETPTVDELLSDDTFVRQTLRLRGLERRGWVAQWWGETDYGAHFYEVRYDFGTADVALGPSWLVSLEGEGRVVPKNLLAEVVVHPREGTRSTYYGREKEVLEALVQHKLESNVGLAGGLLIYFERRASAERDDTIHGWTIQPEREGRFRAYFQWSEGKRRRHAAFEFDYDRQALKADNLQASNILEFGESYGSVEPVDILPKQYHPDRRPGAARWSGTAARAYRDPDSRDRMRALQTVLEERAMIDALEWLLTVRAESPQAFDDCQNSRKCKWKPERRDGHFRVTYAYDLGDGEKSIAWRVDLEAGSIEPVDRLGRLAYRATHLRRTESDS
ncbi:MAG: hypothetical protein ABEL76_08125 [Bradymonadaceae bacterium]